MPSTREVLGYSRSQLILEITSIYKPLGQFYIPTKSITYLPPGGQPQLIPQSLAFLEKNDIATNLVRYPSFISTTYDNKAYEIWPQTVPIYYFNCDGRWPTAESCEIEDYNTIVPLYVVTFARPNSGLNGEWAFLDTLRGTITIYDFQIGASISWPIFFPFIRRKLTLIARV